jgi:CheY-like chemotaxis protein
MDPFPWGGHPTDRDLNFHHYAVRYAGAETYAKDISRRNLQGETMKKPAVILLADDNLDDVFFLRQAFSLAGINHKIIDVQDGQQVIEYLLGEAQYADRHSYPLPALLLLDMRMANKGGFDVLIWLQKRTDFKDMTVVVLSSSVFESDIHRIHALGAAEYVEKSGDFRKLTQLVTKLSQRYLEHPLERPVEKAFRVVAKAQVP